MALYFVLQIALLFSTFFVDRSEADLQSTCSGLTTAQWNVFYEGSCYAGHGASTDWTMDYLEASQSCNDIPGLDGHLAVFPDDFKNLFQYLPYYFTVDVDFTVFLGLERHGPIVPDDPDKNWFWVFPDGSRNPLASGFWIQGQPDQSTENGTKNYGVFMRRGSLFGLGDHDISPTNGYICQYDPTAVTGSIPAGASPPPSSSPEPGSAGAQSTPSTVSGITAESPANFNGSNTAENDTLSSLAGEVKTALVTTASPNNKADIVSHSNIMIVLALFAVVAISVAAREDCDQP